MRSEAIRKERKMRRNNIIIGIILLLLMVFSMFAVYFNGQNNDVNSNLEYNGYKFTVEDVNGGQMAATVVNGQKYYFYNLPQDAKAEIEVLEGIDIIRSSTKIMFVKEPLGLNSQASSEELYFDAIVLDLQSFSGKQVLSGFSEEDVFSDKAVYTCENATADSPVIMLSKGAYQKINITQISEGCFELESDARGLLLLRDYLIYSSLNIIV